MSQSDNAGSNVAYPNLISIFIERRLKLMEENHQHVAELKEEADKLEQEWQQKKICEMMEWKEKTHKKIHNWQVHLEHQKEAW